LLLRICPISSRIFKRASTDIEARSDERAIRFSQIENAHIYSSVPLRKA
jgi:hypothetical protein